MLRETYTSTSQIYFHRQPVPLANGTSGKGLKVSHGQRWDFNHYKLYMFNGYYYILVGGIPISLKNHGLCQLG